MVEKSRWQRIFVVTQGDHQDHDDGDADIQGDHQDHDHDDAVIQGDHLQDHDHDDDDGGDGEDDAVVNGDTNSDSDDEVKACLDIIEDYYHNGNGLFIIKA